MGSGNKKPSGSISDEERLKRQKEEDPTKAKILKGKTPKMICPECDRTLSKINNFYAINQNSKAHKIYATTGKIPVCKDCIRKATFNSDGSPNPEGFKLACQWFDIPYIKSIAMDYLREDNWNVGIYKKDLILNSAYKSWFYEDGLKLEKELEENSKSPTGFVPTVKAIDSVEQISEEDNKIEFTEADEVARMDVINLLGYDVFGGYEKADQKFLYNELLPYLDEDTTEDPFKLSQILQIVNNNNQIRKIDLALSNTDIAKDQAGFKALSAIKNQIVTSTDKIAKENSISVKNRGDKSAGKSTLTSLMKKYRELKFEDAEQDYYDQKKAYGMKLVADISNKSILEQLQLDENDYTEMLGSQREIIQSQQARIDELEEENRQLYVEIGKSKVGESQ